MRPSASRTIAAILLVFLVIVATTFAATQNAAPVSPAAGAKTVSLPSRTPGALDLRETRLELRERIVDAREAVESASHSRLEIIAGWIGVVVGLFGVLITGVIIFFSFNTRALAAAEARKEIADEKEKITRAVADASHAVAEATRMVTEAAANLEQAKAKVTEIETHRVRVASITREVQETAAAVLAGGKPAAKAVEELKLASDAIESNSLREWSEVDFKIRIGAAATRDDARQALDLAIAMRQLFPEDRAQAYALFAEGWALGALGKPDEEIATYDDVIARFGDSDDPELREHVARALLNKGITLGDRGEFREAIEVDDDIIARFGESDERALRERVAKALVNKGVLLGKLGEPDDEIAVYEDVFARFGESDELSLRELVAKALVYKGIILGGRGGADEEIAVYDDVIARFGDSAELSLLEWVDEALFNRACAFARTGRTGAAIDGLRRWRERAGRFDCQAVADDRDFDSIRADPAFVALLEEMGCAVAPAGDQ